MSTPVFELKPDRLASAYGDVALKVYRNDVVAVTGVDEHQVIELNRRVLGHVKYSYEVINDYRPRASEVGLIDATVSIGRTLSCGWQRAVTRDAQAAERLRHLIRQMDVVVDRRSAMTLLTEKKIQLAVAAVNTTGCLLLDDPPKDLNYWERLDYWQAVALVIEQSQLGWAIRSADVDVLTNWLTRFVLIKDQRVVIDAPMYRIRQRIERMALIKIDRERLTQQRQRALLGWFPHSELTDQDLQIQVGNVGQAERQLKRADLTAQDFTVETGRLSHFITQGLSKSDFQLYWLNQRLNL